ncbi:DUF4192 domain-containing protein [Mycobacterium sp. CVI_P3]|uniref:DUF4192 domain-containing protein n=1 Tax=Mycobacterium pinniadriaticum TaxID=2994102 RepID=A0ABT3SGR9_9MYCO|nr:DUF4192 domain-containing protein [Mycobacterium pinniadriaticum]MCX2932185.1 DUF4192 domain-containing protein [Mycobacterium pinniadriaticum]MCX2938715.1 DUF4192 domain-containing protein [Mycobacterium pinniadriaticum]
MTTHEPDYRFTSPGALIAALPAVLGFVPEKSLVLVSLEHGEMGAVMRTDLPQACGGDLSHLAELAAASGADAVVGVIVDAEGAQCPMCNQDYRDLCAELTSALAVHGLGLYAGHVVDRIEAGGRWHCVDGCGAAGVVDDPMSSPLAVAAVLDGRRLYQRRADLQAVVAMADATRSASLVPAIADRAEAREVDRRTDADGCARRDVEAAIEVSARVCDGGEPDDAELASLACALTDVAVRDTLYALSVGADAGRAETLWALLARTLPEPWRVEALVLVAFSAYVRGDGPMAGLSLEAALRADPEHRMAGMLDTALQSGMRPAQIRELADTGYRLAERLGVRLPPRRAFGRRAV